GHHVGDLALVGRDTLVCAHDNTVSLVRLADGTSLAELPRSAGADYNGIALDPSERWVAARADDRIDLFDLTTRTLVAAIPFANVVRASQITADGEHIIAQGASGVMSVLDRSGKVVATFKAEVGNVEIAGDELVYARPAEQNGIAHLAVGDWSGKVRLDL